MAARFITFEGIEGSGKSTQINLLADALKHQGHDIIVTREPGGTRIGDSIRKILLSAENKEIQPLVELLLYEASRAQHVFEIVQPALDSEKIVLCDRYADASTVYQSYARGLPLDMVEQLNHVATGGLKPDLTLLIDLPVEIGLKRARERFEQHPDVDAEDRFEQEELSFHEKVRQGYLELANKEPDRFRIIDGNTDVDSLQQKLAEEVFKWV